MFDTGTYSYDGAGNITAMGNDTFGYDPRSRIAQANYPDALLPGQVERELYTYDLYGNLLNRMNVSGDAFTIDTFCNTSCINNQMLFSTYDARGNLTNGGAVYDGLNRLRLLPTGGNWVYLFNGANERVARVPPGGTANTIYTLRDPANRVATEYFGTTLGRDNLYLGSLLVASRSWNAVAGPVGLTFYHSDHLGSPRVVTDGAAAVVDSRKFWPFGGEVQNQGAPVQRLGFASMERDSEVPKRYYDHARQQDGFWGRFLSPDIVSGYADDPQSWNRYTYSLNNPLRVVDPDGREPTIFQDASARVQPVADAAAVTAQAYYGVPGGLGAGMAQAAGLIDLAARTLNLGTATGEAYGSGADAFALTKAISSDVLTASEFTLAVAGAAKSLGADTTKVVHFTNEAGATAIEGSGNLKAGSYVTKPGEVKGLTAGQVESKLEIAPGKGAKSFTTRVKNSQLVVPENGKTTSGGAWQRQISQPCKVGTPPCGTP